MCKAHLPRGPDAYPYAFAVNGDEAVGTVSSPAGVQQVAGARQDDLLFVGEPEPFHSTRVGTIVLRSGESPPEDVADPAAWIRARASSPADYGLLIRNGVIIEFTNPGGHAELLPGYADQRVDFTGTWEGDRLRIEGIDPEGTHTH